MYMERQIWRRLYSTCDIHWDILLDSKEGRKISSTLFDDKYVYNNIVYREIGELTWSKCSAYIKRITIAIAFNK